MMRQRGKMKQFDIAKFYGVNAGDVSVAFRMARLDPEKWDIGHARQPLYDLYMKRFDNALARAHVWKVKANEIDAKWRIIKNGIAIEKEAE